MSSVKSTSSLIYLLRKGESGATDVERLGAPEGVDAGSSSLSTVEVDGRAHLLAYDGRDGRLDVFEFLNAGPWLRKLPGLRINPGFDHVEPFVIGNRHHLLCYSSKEGAFEFHELQDGSFIRHR